VNHPVSPHQAAIANAQPKVTGPFSAKVRPELRPPAAELVAIYEAVPGALTYPGCMPEALAAVLQHIGDEAGRDWTDLKMLAELLRGWQP
jgi:hypothetical protein